MSINENEYETKDTVVEENSAPVEESPEKTSEVKTEPVSNPEEDNSIVPVCSACGQKLEPNQAFCPSCGKKVVNDIPKAELLTVEKQPKKAPPIKIIIAAAAACAVIAGVIIFFVTRGTPVEKIKLDQKSITLEEGQFYSLDYKITPKKATDKKLTWSSSDKDVATVDKKGQITAVEEGECTIKATASNGVTAKCKVTVEEAGPDLLSVYNELDNSYYCSVGSDGSYLEIDTNPLDLDDGSTYTGVSLVKQANDLLGLPSSVYTKMSNTNALSGTQTYSANKLEISWTYHPDNGLEVIYERTE